MYEGSLTTASGLMGNSLNQPVSTSATERETVALHESVSKVQDLARKLSERLSPVLRQHLPEQGSDVGAEESLPPLANAVRQSRYVAQGTSHILSDILARLDV